MTWESSHRARRLAGLCGLAGALLFCVGDMLFYGHFGSGANFAEGMIATVMRASTARLFAGGLVGPLAACLCIVGFWHVYLNIRPSHVLLARLVLILFSILMVAGSAVHTLWTAKGLALKYCCGQGAPCSDLLAAIKSYWALAYNLGAIPGCLGAVLRLVLCFWAKLTIRSGRSSRILLCSWCSHRLLTERPRRWVPFSSADSRTCRSPFSFWCRC